MENLHIYDQTNSTESLGTQNTQPEVAQQQAPIIQPAVRKKSKTGLLIAILLLGVSALVGYGFYNFTNQKGELKSLSDTQVTTLKTIETKYSDTVSLIKTSNSTSQPSDQNEIVLGSSNEILEFGEELAYKIQGEVLGIEDERIIKDSRKYIELMRDILEEVEKVEKTNSEASTLLNEPLFKTFGSKIQVPTKETQNFVNDTQALITYLSEMQTLSIDLITWVNSVANAIGESILRNADEASVLKVESKVAEVNAIKSSIEQVDTLNLKDDIVIRHRELIDSFDEDIKIFDEIVLALKAKDAVALQKAMISLAVDGKTGADNGTTNSITFWQSNEVLRSVSDVKKLWQELADSL